MNELEIECVVSGEETGGRVAVFEERVAPGGGPPRHVHREQLEIFHVLEGRLRFELDGESFERGTGELAVIPAGAVHAFRNVGPEPALIRFEMLPALRSEEAFRRLTDETIEEGASQAF